jgi:BON domain
MLKREFKWSVLVLSGLLVLSSSLLMASPQDSQNSDDNAITTAIQAKLFQDPSLKTQDIHVSTQDGVVTLTGTVDSPDAQSAVDKIASMEPGVVKVIDSLSVAAAASTPPDNGNQDNSAPPPSQDSQEPSQPAGQSQPFGNAPAQNEPVPPSMLMPSGTMVSVRLNQALSTDQNRSGDVFTATLEQPVVVNGWVVARRGQTVQGQVVKSIRAGRVKGTSELEIALTELTLVNGHQVPLQTRLVEASGGTTKGRDATAVGTTTGLGAMIGAIAGDGEGAAIGAGIGAAAGVAGILLTRGRPTVIPPEALLTFRTVASANISTIPGQAAFRPVTQQDYPQDALQRRPDRYYQGRPPYGPPAYWGYYGWPGYYYPYWGYRPGWYGPGYVGIYRFGGERREWHGDRREFRGGDRRGDRR